MALALAAVALFPQASEVEPASVAEFAPAAGVPGAVAPQISALADVGASATAKPAVATPQKRLWRNAPPPKARIMREGLEMGCIDIVFFS
jgi:hypothetical protein